MMAPPCVMHCRYYPSLLELGAGLPEDLVHLSDSDLDGLGFKKLEKNRLHKALKLVQSEQA
jgi:hypothetical protein